MYTAELSSQGPNKTRGCTKHTASNTDKHLHMQYAYIHAARAGYMHAATQYPTDNVPNGKAHIHISFTSHLRPISPRNIHRLRFFDTTGGCVVA